MKRRPARITSTSCERVRRFKFNLVATSSAKAEQTCKRLKITADNGDYWKLKNRPSRAGVRLNGLNAGPQRR